MPRACDHSRNAPQVEPDGRPCEEATSAAFRGAIPADSKRTRTHQRSIRTQMTETHARHGRQFCVFLDDENADYGEGGQQSPRPPRMSESWQHLLRNV